MATFGELKQQVYLAVGSVDGKTTLMVEQAINNAHRIIASVKDFDELMVLDTTNAATVADVKSYHIVDDFALTRPKDIYSIRYMDEGNSRKLQYISFRRLDDSVPYTEIVGTGKPNFYTRRGMNIELYKIPDEAKSLYIQYSQWPVTLTLDADESPFLNIDDVIVGLSSDMTLALLDGVGGMSGWTSRANQLLGLTIKEEATRPDRTLVAQPFTIIQKPTGEYWKDPFYK